MLTRVDIVTSQGSVLSLPLWDTSLGYLVKDISGLDPVKASVNSSKFAQLDGSIYQSSSLENRNIILTLGFAPDYVSNDIEKLRNFLYDYTMPKSSVTLKFYRDEVFFAQINGVVESCETPLFSRDPEIKISIICFDPDFYAPEPTVLNYATTALANETLINYKGTSPTGFLVTLTPNRVVPALTLYSRRPGGVTQSLELNGGVLQSSDRFSISTVTGDKFARVVRSGAESSILYRVSPASTWLTLYPGENYFRFFVEGTYMPYYLTYTARYGGL